MQILQKEVVLLLMKRGNTGSTSRAKHVRFVLEVFPCIKKKRGRAPSNPWPSGSKEAPRVVQVQNADAF